MLPLSGDVSELQNITSHVLAACPIWQGDSAGFHRGKQWTEQATIWLMIYYSIKSHFMKSNCLFSKSAFENCWRDDYVLLKKMLLTKFREVHPNGVTATLLNTLRPRQNGHHFADDLLKCIFLNGNDRIPIRISLKVVKGVQLTLFQHWFR